jgi:allophanate hydrolase subunit 2
VAGAGPAPFYHTHGTHRLIRIRPEIEAKLRDISHIVSDGIPLGAVQAPADRRPIVMIADRQTIGGYPKIAAVISADIPLLVQCLPGESAVRFEAVSVDEAQLRYRRVMKALV